MTAFLALCLWSSAAWLTVDLLPARLAPIAGQGLHFLLIGLVALIFRMVRRDGGTGPVRQAAWYGLAGVGLLGAPLVLLDAAQDMGRSVSGVVVFSLVPVVAIVGLSRMPLLFPALAGVAGVLLLVPARLPDSTRGWEGLGLIVAAAGVTSACLVMLPRLMKGAGVASGMAVICLANGVLLSLIGLATGGGGWGWSAVGTEMMRGVLVDLPEVVLLLWLVSFVAPYRVAARYLVAPLFTVIEGYMLMRPPLDTRTIVGVALLAAGSWWLLSAEAEETVGPGLLR